MNFEEWWAENASKGMPRPRKEAIRGLWETAARSERERSEKLAAWLQWCLDNCEDSPEYNFGFTATEHMRTLLAGGDAPMPPNSAPSVKNDA